MSNYKNIDTFLEEEMTKFKNNFFANKKELENHQSLMYKNFLLLQKEEEKILRNNEHFIDNEGMKTLSLNGTAIIFMYLYTLQKIKFTKDDLERNKYFNKLQELNNNFDLYKKIEQDYYFIKDKNLIAKKLIDTSKTIEEIRQQQLNFLQQIKQAEQNILNSINKEIDNKKLAFLIADEFNANFNLDKENVLLVRDYLNDKYSTNLEIKDLVLIKDRQLSKKEKNKNKEEERELV